MGGEIICTAVCRIVKVLISKGTSSDQTEPIYVGFMEYLEKEHTECSCRHFTYV